MKLRVAAQKMKMIVCLCFRKLLRSTNTEADNFLARNDRDLTPAQVKRLMTIFDQNEAR